MLDITAPVGTLRPETTGNLPDDVRRVQYLLNKTPESEGAPDFLFNTTSGVCDQDLIDAITEFQRFQAFPGFTPDGRVDVGERTITRLNQVADLSAFAAAREPDEFLSWLRRPPEWNFTLEDLLRLGSNPLTFSPETASWLPSAYQANLVDTFLAVLDPMDAAPGSWGVGAWDLYHGHVAVLQDPTTGLPQDAAANALATSIRSLANAIDSLRASVQPATLTNPQDLDDFAAQLFPILARLTQPLEDLAATGLASVVYHSFEVSQLLGGTSRYAGYRPADPRRNWVTPITPSGAGTPMRYASADNPDNPFKDFFSVLQIAFLVAKDGVVYAVAETKEELVAVTREPYATIA